MKIEVLSKKVICSNDDSLHNYFAWPSVARLRDGRLAMVASGFRIEHKCPFGKSVISYSQDEGETWSCPAPVIDTPLDDRDSGIVAFGESSVIVTSFNNSIESQRNWSVKEEKNKPYSAYINSYLDVIEKKGGWEKYLGSNYRISHDNGQTFGPIMQIPVTCPHGPAVIPDGSLLYVGRKFLHNASFLDGEVYLACYKVFADGSQEYLCEIENIGEGYVSCEPHTIVLDNGTVIVHIRVMSVAGAFTIFQCESHDGGHSFTKPRQLLAEKGGAPAHMIHHNGTLISAYGYRNKPYGIRAMFSKDNGQTWDIDNVILDDVDSDDCGYPSSVVRSDGTILTVFYEKVDARNATVISQVIWRYKD